MMTKKPIPAKIIINTGTDEVITHDLADHTDWGIMFDNTIEVRTEGETFYYPLDSVRNWSVKAYRKKITHFVPEEVSLGEVKRKAVEGN